MGANFLWALAPIWTATDERKVALQQAIDDISDEALAEYEELYHVFNTEDPAEARKVLFESCMFCEASQCETRDTSDMKLAEMNWRAVVTGGLSWGDAPTDAFGPLVMVSTVEEVYNLLKAWSAEDEV